MISTVSGVEEVETDEAEVEVEVERMSEPNCLTSISLPMAITSSSVRGVGFALFARFNNRDGLSPSPFTEELTATSSGRLISAAAAATSVVSSGV